MKKVVAYNLSTVVIKEISDRAKAENRSKSNWLDSFIVKAIFVDEVVSPVIIKPAKTKSKTFRVPTFNEVHAYCRERNNSVDSQLFIDHYESNGWMRGKTKIKCWKACVRTWESKNKANNNGQQRKKCFETTSDRYAEQSHRLQERESAARRNNQDSALIQTDGKFIRG